MPLFRIGHVSSSISLEAQTNQRQSLQFLVSSDVKQLKLTIKIAAKNSKGKVDGDQQCTCKLLDWAHMLYAALEFDPENEAIFV
jgi:hypothetical protein